jgi:hypothetical protein
MQTNGQTSRQKGTEADKWADRQTKGHTGRQADCQTKGQTASRQVGRKAGWQKNGQPDR